MNIQPAPAIIAMLLLFGAWGGEAAAGMDSAPGSVHQADVVRTTIRNPTKSTVHIRIKPHGTKRPGESRILETGAVEIIEGPADLDITFPRAEGRTTIRIEAGKNYAFRHDADGLLQLYLGSHGDADAADLAPYVQTPMVVVDRMLDLAGVSKQDVVFDIGCGDGRIVIRAAQRFGARGVGIDIVPERIAEARTAALKAFVEDFVEFRQENALVSDFTGATVVFMYLIPESNALLRPVLENALAPGARVISHAYPIPGWEKKLVSVVPVHTGPDEIHYLYFYGR